MKKKLFLFCSVLGLLAIQPMRAGMATQFIVEDPGITTGDIGRQTLAIVQALQDIKLQNENIKVQQALGELGKVTITAPKQDGLLSNEETQLVVDQKVAGVLKSKGAEGVDSPEMKTYLAENFQKDTAASPEELKEGLKRGQQAAIAASASSFGEATAGYAKTGKAFETANQQRAVISSQKNFKQKEGNGLVTVISILENMTDNGRIRAKSAERQSVTTMYGALSDASDKKAESDEVGGEG